MKCKICEGEAKLAQKLTLRGKYEASYGRCDNCGFLFIDNPTWLKEAYEEPINISDTGYVSRNVYLSKKTLLLFSLLFGTKHTYLDYAGGYGILTRLMRDYGLNFLHHDKYTPNLFAKGFEYKNEKKIKAISCFECFEHLSSPIKEIGEIFEISSNILFSTRIPPKEMPDKNWEYYGIEHGQHVSFYSLETLQFLAKKFNKNLCSDSKNIHLLTDKKIPNWLFKLLLFLPRLQLDVLVRKLLNSKTSSDSKSLSSKI
jgi:hypothetical protein